MLGKKMSKESRLKISKFRKGKTYEELYGEEKAKILRNGMNLGKNNPNYGKKLSYETKGIISKKRVEYFKTHPPTYPKMHFVEALGHGVRSSWEKEVGMILKNNDVPYGYETTRFDLGDCSYTPDFEITPEMFIEVKGYLSQRCVEKLKKFKKLYPNIKLIGIGTGDKSVYDIHLKWEDRNELEAKMKESFTSSHTAEIQPEREILRKL
jgi:hypothetical protein